MKILVVNWQDWTHPAAGGAEFHLREVFGRLATGGHRVDLLCSAFEGAPSEERLDGINVIRRGRHYRLFNYTAAHYERTALRSHPYDVVVDDLNKIPFYSPLFVRAPVVALVHHLMGPTSFRETNPAFASYVWLGERAIAAVYRNAPFISVSPSTTDDLVRRGVRRDRITVIPNGVSDEAFDRRGDMQRSSTPLFVYLGRIKRYKAIELIIEAFALVQRERPDARLVIAGDGDHRSTLERRAGAAGVGASVTFPGWVGEEEKWRLLRAAWALCYTSPNEGWGLSSVEAQAVGTIAIVSDSPGLRDTIVHRETGWLVPHGSVPDLAARMRWVIDEPDARETMAARAREHAAAYRWGSIAERTLDVLRSAAGEEP